MLECEWVSDSRALHWLNKTKLKIKCLSIGWLMSIGHLPLVNLNFDEANLNHGFAQSPSNPGSIGCAQCPASRHYRRKPFANRKYPNHDGIGSELQSLRPLHDPILKWPDFVRPHCGQKKQRKLSEWPACVWVKKWWKLNTDRLRYTNDTRNFYTSRTCVWPYPWMWITFNCLTQNNKIK